MSEKRSETQEALNIFVGLFDDSITQWEKTVSEEKLGKDDKPSTELKLKRRLTNARFNALDALNLQLKAKIKEAGGRIPTDD